MSACIFVHICVGIHRGQKRARMPDLLELKVHQVLSYQTSVLGTEPRSNGSNSFLGSEPHLQPRFFTLFIDRLNVKPVSCPEQKLTSRIELLILNMLYKQTYWSQTD